jgi:hypothetical protein
MICEIGRKYGPEDDMKTPSIWSQKDKLLHFAVSFALVAVLDIFLSLSLAVVITAAVGFAKEICDKLRGGEFDRLDLWADTAGVTMYGLLVFAITILR